MSYRFGRRKEQQLGRFLYEEGADVELSPGSRGACDLHVRWSGARAWCVQVKATRHGGDFRGVTAAEARRIRAKARQRGALPVLASMSGNEVVFLSLESGRLLKP